MTTYPDIRQQGDSFQVHTNGIRTYKLVLERHTVNSGGLFENLWKNTSKALKGRRFARARDLSVGDVRSFGVGLYFCKRF